LGLFRLLDRAVGLLVGGFGLLAGLVIGLMALAISAEVVMRALGLPPFGWTLELAEYGLLVVGFLGAPWVLRTSDHIRVDVVLRSVGPATRGRLLMAGNAVACLTCAVLTVYAFQAAHEAFARGSLIFKNLVIPQWPILAILPLGMALLALEFLSRVARRLAGRPAPQEDVTESATL
jgi:TRAP-type C4-dicarboxylate transport system permease small subunit